MSGVAYAVEVGTTSYGMKGEKYTVIIRTRELFKTSFFLERDLQALVIWIDCMSH